MKLPKAIYRKSYEFLFAEEDTSGQVKGKTKYNGTIKRPQFIYNVGL